MLCEEIEPPSRLLDLSWCIRVTLSPNRQRNPVLPVKSNEVHLMPLTLSYVVRRTITAIQSTTRLKSTLTVDIMQPCLTPALASNRTLPSPAQHQTSVFQQGEMQGDFKGPGVVSARGSASVHC